MVWKALVNDSSTCLSAVAHLICNHGLQYTVCLYASVFVDRRRTELIPEDINRQHVQTLQDSLLPDIQKNLEDFR